jgi:SAM-dependent methyltransferase
VTHRVAERPGRGGPPVLRYPPSSPAGGASISDDDFYRSHAALYDLAFSWDVEDEVAWLLSRFGEGTASVLEPACGNGRLFPGFLRRGVAVAGVDLSREMLAKAAERLRSAALPEAALAVGDIRDFDLGRRFDGAFVPVNSLGYLHSHDDLVRHLRAVARHLRPGGRYLVQQGLRDVARLAPLPDDGSSRWEVETPHGRLLTTWRSGPYDPATRLETQVSRFEWTSGPSRGAVVEHEHVLRVWDWASWSAALAETPFAESAAFDGNRAARPPLPVGPSLEGFLLAWHELSVPADPGPGRPAARASA